MKNLNLVIYGIYGIYGIYAGSKIQNLPRSGGILFVYKNIEFTNEFKVYSSEDDKSNLYLSLKDIKYCENLNDEAQKMLDDVELIPNERYKNIAFAYSLCEIKAEIIDDLVEGLKKAYNLPTTLVNYNNTYQLTIHPKSYDSTSFKYKGLLLDNNINQIYI